MDGKKGEIAIKKLIRNNSALAGVIEALLLIALVALILSIIQMNYIPSIMSERESDHMDVVEKQFSQLKSTIEMQSIMGSIDTDNPVVYSMLSSPITLGSNRLPYFVTMGARGDIVINDRDDVTDYKIKFNPMSITEYDASGIPLTSIEYTAYNHYYLNGRTLKYILEGGAIILNQSNMGEVMKAGPAISVENRSDNGYIKIYWDIPVFIGAEGKKRSATEFSNCYVRTNYSGHNTHTDSATSSIKILTKHLDVWYEYLASNTEGLFHEYIENGYVDVDIVNYDDMDPGSPLCVRIQPVAPYDLRVAVTVVKIGAQTGPGVT